MCFIHFLSPHITLRKNECLYDKDLPSQHIKDDINNGDRNENLLPTKDIPSFNSPFGHSICPYTTNFK